MEPSPLKPLPKSVAVLEWLAGGGLCLAEEEESSLAPLLNEGLQMLQCLAAGVSSQGVSVHSVVDHRLLPAAERNAVTEFPEAPATLCPHYFSQVETVDSVDDIEHLLNIWIEVASQCEAAIIVAPEIDQILQNVLSSLRSRTSCDIINCSSPFLDIACDKFQFATHCRSSRIPHPATSIWPTESSSATVPKLPGKWVCKSRFGAGCENLHIGTNPEALHALSDSPTPADPSILQDWIEGQAYSCTAIASTSGEASASREANTSGSWHWLPLMTQEFELSAASALQSLHYKGGAIVAEPPQVDQLHELQVELNNVFRDGARGLVGFDLAYSKEQQQWFVIEANPRCTTSIVELQQNFGGEIFARLLRA